MKTIIKLSFALVVGILSCFTASAQHESEASIEISDNFDTFSQLPWYGQVNAIIKKGCDYKGEVVIPSKYLSASLNTYAKVSWVDFGAMREDYSNWHNTTSFYVPASATMYATRFNRTTQLGYEMNYADGSWYFSSNPNLKTAVYESPHPPFDNMRVTVCNFNKRPDGDPERWDSWKQEISQLKTAFDKNPFAECPSIKSIVVLDPNTRLHSIKGVLFKDYDEQQELVAYPQGRKDEAYSIPAPTFNIRNGAFPSGCKLKSIELPVTLKSADSDAFSQLTGLTSVIVNWTEPVEFFSVLFSDETYTKCTLQVPDGTMADYATTVPWSLFANIVEKSAGVDSPVASSKELTCDVYTISGILCKSSVHSRDWQDGLAPGVYILRMSNGSTLKHIVK